MKKIFKKFFAIILVILTCASSILTTYASINTSVIEGLKQVVEQGGENDTNTVGEKDGVKVSKTITETEFENYFDIKLTVETNEMLAQPDLSVVLVMDVSNTMTYAFGDKTRLLAAQEAGKNFLDKFAANSIGVNATRKIGFVAFNTNAHNIFGLTPIADNNSRDNLKNKMVSETNEIVNTDGYADSHDRFTNIEAGLKMARDMLNGSSAKNKYIIFLSDGFPTTYINSDYTGYDTYDPSGTRFKDRVTDPNRPCSYGVSYSDEAAIRARKMASDIKSGGNVKIYSVGIDIGGQTIKQYVDQTQGKKWSVVDRYSTSYEIGSADSANSYKNWLKNSIGSGYYYDSTNFSGLNDAFNKIFEDIMKSSEATWVAEDPMNTSGNNKNIQFVGIYNDDKTNFYPSINQEEGFQNTASYDESGDRITWDLKKSGYTTRKEGNVTYYKYELNYRIRLQNELEDFDINKIYKTNGVTRLTYVVRNNEVLSDNKYIDFPIPSVVGYLGNLSFNKMSNYTNGPLSGAKFELVHDENCNLHDSRKYPKTIRLEAISDENGIVNFDKIPSGHKYILREIEAPSGYIKSDDEYNVTVTYGETISNLPENNKIYNTIETGDIEIEKNVTWGDKNKDFDFEIEADVIDGNYEAERYINDALDQSFEGTVHFENKKTQFKLKHNERLVIRKLPSDVRYKVTEKEESDYITTSSNSTGAIKKNETSSVIFYNQKKPEPVKVSFKAIKTMDGDTPSQIFTFILTDENGNIIQTKTNSGKDILFDEIVFDKEGQYIYFVKEVIPTDQGNIIYDDTVYKVIVNVTKDNDYKASVEYYAEGSNACITDILFRNRTKPVDVKVEKRWENMGSINIPGEIKVQLYRNGVPYQMVSLSSVNNWTYTWIGLDGRYQYTVDEVEVPQYFYKKVQKSNAEENYWIITNVNTLTVVLPETGGRGSENYILTGASMMLLSFVVGCVYKLKKKES